MLQKKKGKKVAPAKQPTAIFPEKLDARYTNLAFLLMSDRDLLIDFGIRRPELGAEGKGNVPTEIHTRIMMSPQHAKNFLGRLQHVVEMYEKDFGEIVTSPKKK